jgi:hypothetical protein
LLDAMAKSAGRLAKGDQARFMTDVAKLAGASDEPVKPVKPVKQDPAK